MVARIIADDKEVYYKVKTIAEYVKEEKDLSAYRVNKVVKENKITTKLVGFGKSSFLEELEAIGMIYSIRIILIYPLHFLSLLIILCSNHMIRN